jgi:hypothetical protein
MYSVLLQYLRRYDDALAAASAALSSQAPLCQVKRIRSTQSDAVDIQQETLSLAVSIGQEIGLDVVPCLDIRPDLSRRGGVRRLRELDGIDPGGVEGIGLPDCGPFARIGSVEAGE